VGTTAEEQLSWMKFYGEAIGPDDQLPPLEETIAKWRATQPKNRSTLPQP